MVNRKMIKGHEIHLERMQDTLIHLKDSLCLSVFLFQEIMMMKKFSGEYLISLLVE